MRWARVEIDGQARYGIVEDDDIVLVQGSPFGEYQKGARVALRSVKLLPPVSPPTFYACGLNYHGHIDAVERATGNRPATPTFPEIGYRANNALSASGDPIVIPSDATELVQYEGELVVVIGRKAKHMTVANALSCVFGYSIGNDVSERTWQRKDRTFWRSKNADGFSPMGPWIETDVQLDSLRTLVRLNGETVEDFPTNDMIFSVAEYIAAITRYITLHPGDVIWMGTDGAPRDMRHGDHVEVEIVGIGTLSNPVVRAEPPPE